MEEVFTIAELDCSNGEVQFRQQVILLQRLNQYLRWMVPEWQPLLFSWFLRVQIVCISQLTGCEDGIPTPTDRLFATSFLAVLDIFFIIFLNFGKYLLNFTVLQWVKSLHILQVKWFYRPSTARLDKYPEKNKKIKTHKENITEE